MNRMYNNSGRGFTRRERGFPWGATLVLFTVVTILIAAIAIPFVGGLFPNYSEGERVGVVYKVSKKGLLFKSFEGSMNLAGVGTDGAGMIVANRFDFSIKDPELLNKFNSAAASGQRVSITYTQYWVKPVWLDTNYVATKVTVVKAP